MKIVIRRKSDGKFLTLDNEWTHQIEEAKDFDNTTRAQEFCASNELCEVEVLLKYKDTFQVTLPCP